MATLDAEHGQRHCAVDAGGSHVAALGDEAKKLGVIEEVIKPARGVPEEREVLLEIHIDAAEEDGGLRLR